MATVRHRLEYTSLFAASHVVLHCSTTACFPLETVRTRMAVSPKSYSGIVDCFHKTVMDKGLSQLYRVRCPADLAEV